MQKSSKKQKLTPGGEADKNTKKCLGVLKALQRNPRAGPFLMPVDWKALQLPQYPKMIKHPMDLGTVETKLLGGSYKTIRDWADDVNQLGPDGSLLHRACFARDLQLVNSLLEDDRCSVYLSGIGSSG